MLILIIVNTNVAVNLLEKKVRDAHGVTMKEKAPECISSANGMVVSIVGMASITILLVPTLEVDIVNVIVCLGEFYQGLLGMMCYIRTRSFLAWPPLHCSGWISGQQSAGYNIRWDVLQLLKWSCRRPPRC